MNRVVIHSQRHDEADYLEDDEGRDHVVDNDEGGAFGLQHQLLGVAIEAGPARAPLAVNRPRTLYERDPLRFWQSVAALLALRCCCRCGGVDGMMRRNIVVRTSLPG